MDVAKILAELKQERDAIEEAIVTLERLALGRGKRRGRPPTWMVEAAKRRGKDGDLDKETTVPPSRTPKSASVS